ncbi:hypothetical protein D8B26_001969 [Coccidioides posadasii str. Silveira]|uniref:uncharacterized protein n=1 Tax=Coccidioides posadasii (strain RMSCC 757 / Silveira) TaxID=443226 RepID=UPI001BEFE015|nr:hypothetical protein D8B26_001969 [Coccidioides posadasii str. Silveira]
MPALNTEMAPTALKFYTHRGVDLLISLLQLQLPQSGTLLRRLQHDIVRKSPTACYLATFSPTDEQASASHPASPWLVAYVDLYAWPGTQVWLYSSLQAESSTVPGHKSTFNSSDAHLTAVRSQLLSLITYCFDKLLPRFISSPEAQGTSANGGHGAHPNRPPSRPLTTILLGSVHSGVVKLLEESIGLMSRPRFHIPQPDYCVKYSFARSVYDPVSNASSSLLPPGYRFCTRDGVEGFQSYHYDLIKSRSFIVRQRKALEDMASVVMYHDGTGNIKENGRDWEHGAQEMPVGWAFLGYDASLVSLHVEQEHRGRGLAAALAKSVMRRGMLDNRQFFFGKGDGEERWAFADVMSYNDTSHRVMKKMGGESVCTVSWVSIEPCTDEHRIGDMAKGIQC